MSITWQTSRKKVGRYRSGYKNVTRAARIRRLKNLKSLTEQPTFQLSTFNFFQIAQPKLILNFEFYILNLRCTIFTCAPLRFAWFR